MELINVLASICDGDTIPEGIFTLTHTIILVIQVIVPILLIIWGMLDFVKAVMGGDEGKIKDAQKVFIKRLIAAIVVFLIITIVKLAVNLVSDLGAENVNTTNIQGCIDKFINGPKGSGN